MTLTDICKDGCNDDGSDCNHDREHETWQSQHEHRLDLWQQQHQQQQRYHKDDCLSLQAYKSISHIIGYVYTSYQNKTIYDYTGVFLVSCFNFSFSFSLVD